MIAYIFLPIVGQLLFPIFSLIVMGAYLKGLTLLVVAIAIVANALVLKPPCFKRQIASLPKFYKQFHPEAKEDKTPIFLTGLLTSWIAPCTVWSNAPLFESCFLLVSSFTTFAIYFTVIVATFLYGSEDNSLDYYYLIFALIFLGISSISSVWLHLQGKYQNYYQWTQRFCCGSPIIHPMFLQDTLVMASTSVKEKEIINQAVESNWKLFMVKS